MYLQAFEEKLLSAGGDNRRRHPRVKPDEFGRFDPAELEAEIFVPEDEAGPARRKSPLRMAAAGIVAGLVVSVIAVFAFQGGGGPAAVDVGRPVVASTAAHEGQAPTRAVGDASSMATPSKVPPPTAPQIPRQASVQVPLPALAPPKKGEEAIRPEPRMPVAAVAPREIVVVMPADEEDGALLVAPGPESGEGSAALVVLQ